ncbi:T9SS type A sorting domain-containing protein [Dyadobacter psychrotolerans]|nr:T9SS type A sorting domain-containing protein [Dyadobacter psychrotolerans]
MIKTILSFCFIFVSFITVPGFTQKINFVSFDKLPADKQLFARDKNNEGEINISGKVEATGYAYVSVVKYRNKVRTGYQKSNIQYTGSAAPFQFSTKIKSELAEYAFEFYACKSATDSVRIVRRDDVVAGDFYIIYGQSNAVAWEVDYTYRNEYCRSFGSFQGGATTWGLSNELTPRVGIFGIEFQKRISEKYGFPTCVINGATAGSSLQTLLNRIENNHADTSTPYGTLLNYAQQTGLLPNIKGIYYWQGENEAAGDNPLSWAPLFKTMVDQWKEDYPNVEKIYVFQLPLFGGGGYDDRIGQFRESQRTLDRLYPIIQPYAALGAPGWNGFHYGLEGYLKLGQDLADMAGFYHYGKKEKITSPSVQKIFYSSPKSDEITMVFEDYQQMVYPNDTINNNIEGSLEPVSTYSVKDFFYLNGEWQKLKSGRAEANKIIVELKTVGKDTLIKYLPSKYHYSGLLTAPWVYIGPFLRNSKGFRAFAFHHTKIFPYTNLGTLKLEGKDEQKSLTLSWNALPNVKGYILERVNKKDSLPSHEVMYLLASQTEYTDATAKKGVEYTYSIRAYTDQSESAISSLILTKLSEDVQPEIMVTAFPNPATELVNITSTASGIVKIDVYTVTGKKIKSETYTSQDWVTVRAEDLSRGQYVFKVYTEDGLVTSKLILLM